MTVPLGEKAVLDEETSFGPDRVDTSTFGIKVHRASSTVPELAVVCPFRQCCELPNGPVTRSRFSFCPSCAQPCSRPRKRSKRSVRQEKRFQGLFLRFEQLDGCRIRSHHLKLAHGLNLRCLMITYFTLSVWRLSAAVAAKGLHRHMLAAPASLRCRHSGRLPERGNFVTLVCTDV